jgi:hypothetical protein
LACRQPSLPAGPLASPSVRELSTKRSIPANSRAASGTAPNQCTRSWIPRAAVLISSVFRRGPSPSTATRKSTSLTAATASKSTSHPFSSLRRPTHPITGSPSARSESATDHLAGLRRALHGHSIRHDVNSTGGNPMSSKLASDDRDTANTASKRAGARNCNAHRAVSAIPRL